MDIKKLLEQRIIELTIGSKDTPNEVLDFVKVFALDSSNATADRDFYAITIECTKSHYPKAEVSGHSYNLENSLNEISSLTRAFYSPLNVYILLIAAVFKNL